MFSLNKLVLVKNSSHEYFESYFYYVRNNYTISQYFTVYAWIAITILFDMVAQVFTWFNRRKGAFYWFHCHFGACGSVTVKLFVVLTTLKFAPDYT